MEPLDKADQTEQTAHGGHTEVGTVAEWQRIETAPKDGTSILATMAGCGDGPFWVVYWNDSAFECVSSGKTIPLHADITGGMTHWMRLPAPPQQARCICHRCIKEHDIRGWGGIPLSGTRMILCTTCGNKRCPKASDHDLACTASNEPGQLGSVYE